MSGHTPGPWEVGGPYPSVSVIYCVEPARMSHEDPDPGHYEAVCVLDSRISGEPNKQALIDARLIAAAPDLLAACELALARREDPVGINRTIESLRAAVAKARGGE